MFAAAGAYQHVLGSYQHSLSTGRRRR
jgi:hypothetical protein